MRCRMIVWGVVAMMSTLSGTWNGESAAMMAAETPVTYSLLREEIFGRNELDVCTARPYGDAGFSTETTPDGQTIYICNAGDTGRSGGVAFSVTVDQTRPEPIFFAAESEADDVGGGSNSDYAMYTDLVYTDGTPEWGIAVPFAVGSHGWERGTKTFTPTKPVRSLTFYLLMRNHTGVVRFRNPEVRLVQRKNGESPRFGFFDGTPVRISVSGKSGGPVTISRPLSTVMEKFLDTTLYVRDVGTDSDWYRAVRTDENNDRSPHSALTIATGEPTVYTAAGLQIEALKAKDLTTIEPPEMTAQSSRMQYRIRNLTGTDRAVTLVVAIPIQRASGIAPLATTWLPAPDVVIPIEPENATGDDNNDNASDGGREYTITTATAAGTGRLGIWPMAGIRMQWQLHQDAPDPGRLPANSGSADGIALDLWIMMEPDAPAVSRIFYNSRTDELCAAFDLGFALEKPNTEIRFRTEARMTVLESGSPHPAPIEWAYRKQWSRSQYYVGVEKRRIADQGLWMPFAAISKVPSPEDFGFRFKEGNDETAWDDAHGILTFRYTEPMTWWMSMAGVEKPWTQKKAVAEAERLAKSGDHAAMAWQSSAMHDPDGRPVAQILDTPWCNGAVWSINSAPGIVGEVTDFREKFSAGVVESLYGKTPDGGSLAKIPQKFIDDPTHSLGLDGEYIDSSEGYVTRELDGRRDHFAAMTTPLTFEQATRKPAIFRGLVVYEYTKALSDEMRARGKLMMANSTPDRLWWLAPMLDVLGTETDWNPRNTDRSSHWRPMPIDAMVYRRVLSGTNAYCYLQNTDFDQFPAELVEKYMARSVAYGFFPGFFSADASTGHYFSRPELYERDRPLFRKYLPVAKTLTLAGWEPVPLLREIDRQDASLTGTAPLVIERFGRHSEKSDHNDSKHQNGNSSQPGGGDTLVYWTLFNPTMSPIITTLEFSPSMVPSHLTVMLGGAESVTWNATDPKRITIRIAPESLVVIGR